MSFDTALNRREFERLLDGRIADIAIMFSFHGIGIGETYCELSGCTSETEEYERIANKYKGRGIDIIGVSTGQIPQSEGLVKYLRLPQPCPPFDSVEVDGKKFLARDSFFISGDEIKLIKVEDVASHILEAEKWIDEQLGLES